MRDLIGSLCGSEGIKAVILGVALDSGWVALAAGVTSGSKLDASEHIAESTKIIKGGGGKGKEFAMAGGKDVYLCGGAEYLVASCYQSWL